MPPAYTLSAEPCTTSYSTKDTLQVQRPLEVAADRRADVQEVPHEVGVGLHHVDVTVTAIRAVGRWRTPVVGVDRESAIGEVLGPVTLG